jgi:hypothetical protein
MVGEEVGRVEDDDEGPVLYVAKSLSYRLVVGWLC